MSKGKIIWLLGVAGLLALSGCTGGTKNSSAASSPAVQTSSTAVTTSSASSSEAGTSIAINSSTPASQKATVVFNASAISSSTKLQPTTTGAFTATDVAVTSFETTNVYGSGKDYIKIGTKSSAGSIRLYASNGYAISAARLNMALVAAGSATVTFADSTVSAGVSGSVTGVSFADVDFTMSNTTGANTYFEINVPAKAPVYVASITLFVTAGIETKATSLSLDSTAITVATTGNDHTLIPTVLPTGVTFPAVTYSTDDATIATVDASGVVKGVKVGQTSVKAVLPAAHSETGVDLVATATVEVIDPTTLLLVSNKDGSTYGGTAKSADVTGTGYASQKSKYNQRDLSNAEEIADLRSVGTQNILVLPIIVTGYEGSATETRRQNLFKTFFGDPSDTGWESLASYYWKSSYQQLLLKGTVSEWWNCGYSTSAISGFTDSEWKSFDPTWRLLQEGIAWYKDRYNTDCKEFDNDNDGYIDGVWMIYSCPDYSKNSALPSTFWAYTFEDFRWEPSVGDPVGHKYAWASYDFMDEGYGLNGNDAHTYIHETGHMMGLEDYYTYSGASNYGPMGKLDMMDANIIDHNAFSKFSYGWIEPYVVTDSCEITLHPSATTGECVLLPTADGWNGSAFDEYMLMEFYTPTNLNKKDSDAPYAGNKTQGFTENGVRIYHVDARMVTASYSGGWGAWSLTDDIQFVKAFKDTDNVVKATYTMGAFSNSDSRQQMTDGIYKEFRLLQTMDCTKKRDFNYGVDGQADNTSLFQSGDSFSLAAYEAAFPQYHYTNPDTKVQQKADLMNNGEKLPFSVAFSDMSADSIKLTITKAAA